MLGHYDAEYDTTPRVFKGWWQGRHSIHNDANGNPQALNLWSNDDKRKLNLNYCKLQNRWNRNCVFARRNLFHFSPYLLGEFCFCSWPYQPPSILPISSIFTDRAIYLLSSRDFVSQSIIKNTFNVSTFLIAKRT